jgi:two-component system sensor histidine kinase YesM
MKSSMRELELVERNMNTLICDVEDYARILSTDHKLQYQLKLKEDSPKSQVSQIDINIVLSESLSNIVSPNTRVAAASIMDTSGRYFEVGPVDKNMLYNTIGSEFVVKANERITPVWTSLFRMRYNSGVTEDAFAIAKAVIHKDTGVTIGTVFIYIKEKTIESIYLDKTENINGRFYITDNNGIILSSRDKSELYGKLDDRLGSNIGALENQSTVITEHNRKVLVSSRNFEKLGWRIIDIVPLDEITVETEKINRLIFLLVLFFLIISFLAAYGASKTISKPILRLVSIMKGVSSKDEVGVLGEGFNGMMDKIDGLILEINEEQKLKREFEFKLLQSQINPHFLYNSIETIVSLITLDMKEEAVSTARNLAGFYRISLSKGRDIITVEEEMNLIESYLQIQKYRYIDYMDYSLDFQKEILPCKIPKLTLQPVVENSIYHGIKVKSGKGVISIWGRIEDGKAVIEVFDNGVGMTAEQREYALRHTGDSGKGHSFGLGNVDSRIKLMYGDEYGICIESEPGSYTRVRVELPYTTQG